MKLTVVTDKDGAIVGAMQGHVERPDPDRPSQSTKEFRAGLAAGPGQRLHQVEAPDELGKIADPNEFGQRLTAFMGSKAKAPGDRAPVSSKG